LRRRAIATFRLVGGSGRCPRKRRRSLIRTGIYLGKSAESVIGSTRWSDRFGSAGYNEGS
jgi:hypothetical protein